MEVENRYYCKLNCLKGEYPTFATLTAAEKWADQVAWDGVSDANGKDGIRPSTLHLYDGIDNCLSDPCGGYVNIYDKESVDGQPVYRAEFEFYHIIFSLDGCHCRQTMDSHRTFGYCRDIIDEGIDILKRGRSAGSIFDNYRGGYARIAFDNDDDEEEGLLDGEWHPIPE